MKAVRRFCVAILVGLCVSLPAAPAFAQTDTSTPDSAPLETAAPAMPEPIAATAEQTMSTEVPAEESLSCAKPGVVRPNCGVKPQQAGDRGGALQYTVWVVLLVGLAVIFTVVFRSAARTNRRKTAEAADRDWN